MEARSATRIESAADLLAAVALASAVAVGALRLGISPTVAAALAASALFLAWKILTSIKAETPTFALVDFAPETLPEVEAPEELILTDVYLPAEPEVSEPDALVLDDVLTELGEDSRVVRLFDPAAMPTPGQLKSRIDRHLGSSIPPGTSPDASQELHEALAELRRTLR